MVYVQRLIQDELEKFIPFMTKEYFEDYARDETLWLYGIYDAVVPCGVIMLEYDGMDVKIQYLYLIEEKNEELFSVLNAIAYELYPLGARRMLWEFLDDKKATTSRQLQALGFDIVQKEIAVFEFSLKALAKAPMLTKPYQNVVALSDIDNITVRNLGNMISMTQNAMISLPIKKEDYIADCSVVYMEEQEAKALLLLQRDDNHELFIPYIYSVATDPMAIVHMMRFMFQNAIRQFEAEETCVTYVVQPVLVKIIEKLTGIQGKYQQLAIRNFELLEYAIRTTEKLFE